MKRKENTAVLVNRCQNMPISVSPDFPSWLKTWSYNLSSGLYWHVGQIYSCVWSFPIRLEKSSDWFNFSVAGEIQRCTGTYPLSYLSLCRFRIEQISKFFEIFYRKFCRHEIELSWQILKCKEITIYRICDSHIIILWKLLKCSTKELWLALATLQICSILL